MRTGTDAAVETSHMEAMHTHEPLKLSEEKKDDDDEVIFNRGESKVEIPQESDILSPHQDEREARRKKRRRNKNNFGTATLSDTRSAKSSRSIGLDAGDSRIINGGSVFDSLIGAKKLKYNNIRQLQSLENRFTILKRNEESMVRKIEAQRRRAEQLVDI
jgi:hypothetical protein